MGHLVNRFMLLALVMLAVPGSAAAAVFNVTSTGDNVAACSGSSCPSLRSAVLAADAAGGTNTINVPAGNYKLTRTPSGPDDGTTGDLHLTASLSIDGAGAGKTTITGDGDRLFDISADTVTISDVTITGGSQENEGGAISDSGASLTLTGDAFTHNTALSPDGLGGAVFMRSSSVGTMTVTDSSFSSNTAANSITSGGGFGGAIMFEPNDNGTLTITGSEFDSNAAQSGSQFGGGFGGAVMFEPGEIGTLTVTGSSFSSNAAEGGSSSQGGFGGGIMFEPSAAGSALNLTNSTFTGNSAGGPSGFGGAITFQPNSGSSATLTHVTIVANTATNSSSAGGLDLEDSPVTIRNSIVSGNTVGAAVANCAESSGATLTAAGHNIEHGTTCGFDINADPRLAALANNGGPTKTMAELPPSPAIDAAAVAFCPASDQRGVHRPDVAGTSCDIGAYEFVALKPPVNSGLPVISGTPLPGHRLSCSTGRWTNHPTKFAFRWDRNGQPIPGTSGKHYVVQLRDAAQTLTCIVTASNAAGAGAPATSHGVIVGSRSALHCPKPTGSIRGTALGPLSIGMTQKRARQILKRFDTKLPHFDNFCLFAGWGIRAAYGSSGKFVGKIIFALTANPFYALDGVHPGDSLHVVKHRLHLGKPLHVGLNFWYLIPGAGANGVLKTRGDLIYEVGIAAKPLTGTRRDQLKFFGIGAKA